STRPDCRPCRGWRHSAHPPEQHLLVGVDHRLQIEATCRAREGGRREALPLLVVLEQPDDRLCEGERIARRHEGGGNAVIDGSELTVARRRSGREAGGRRLDERDREALVVRRKDEQVERLYDRRRIEAQPPPVYARGVGVA